MGCTTSSDVSGLDEPFRVESLRTCIGETPAFRRYLSLEQMDDLALSFQKREFLPNQQGEVIAKVGDPLKHFYIIEKGQVAMQVLGDEDMQRPSASMDRGSHMSLPHSTSPSSKKSKSMNNNFAATSVFNKSRGEFVGVGFFKPAKVKKWSVSVVATGSGCTMWYMTKQAYEDFIDLHPNVHQSMLDSVGLSMEPELKTIDVFSDMSEVKREILASLFRYTVLAAGKVLFREGDVAKQQGHSLYFVSQGHATVHAEVEGEDKLLTELRPGHFFGELGLLIGIPRTATVRAKSLCLLLELTQADFRKFAVVCPEVLQRFKDRIDKYQINLAHWLYNSHVMSYFIAFCQREFTVELLEFWRACQAFNDLGHHLTHKPKAGAGGGVGAGAALQDWEDYRATLWASIDTLMCLSDEQKAELRNKLGLEVGLQIKLITLEDNEEPSFMRYKKSTGGTLTEQAKVELLALANLMADQYIRPSASKQVNISARVSQAITTALDENAVELGMFEEAEANVRGLMKRNSWKRFEADAQFTVCLDAWYAVSGPGPNNMDILRQISAKTPAMIETERTEAAMANQLTTPRSRS